MAVPTHQARTRQGRRGVTFSDQRGGRAHTCVRIETRAND